MHLNWPILFHAATAAAMYKHFNNEENLDYIMYSYTENYFTLSIRLLLYVFN